MPIQNYTKPQSFLRQNLEVLESSLAADMNAFVYGPQYHLSRYTDATERPTLDTKTPATGAFAAVNNVEPGEVLDQSFTKVFVEDGIVTLGTLADGVDNTYLMLLSLMEPNKVFYTESFGSTHTPLAIPTVNGRAVRVGDYLELTAGGGEVVRRKVVAVEDYNSGGTVVTNGVLVLDGAATTEYVTGAWADNEDDDGAIVADVLVPFNGELPANNYTANTTGANVTGLAIELAGATGNPYTLEAEGKLYLHTRALVPPTANEPIRRLASSADITEHFGKVDPDNTLAYALSRALSGSQGKVVYGARVPSDDLTGYNTVLRKASQNLNLYVHAPLSFDLTVQQAVADHCEAMSQWGVKRWRRAYVATDVPTRWELLTVDTGGNAYTALVDASGVLTVASTNLDLVAAGVLPGDIVAISNSEYVVKKVLGPITMTLETAPDSAITTATAFTVDRGDTARAQTTYAANRSAQFSSRRVVNVWCDSGNAVTSDGKSLVVDNRFLAAEIAGLRSASLPHQGLTRTEVKAVSSAPLMYTKYTESDLDVAAAAGVFIVTQDLEGGPVYIRHQLTTNTDQGSLYYEDSVGANIDDISFGLVNIVDGYIGRRNATSDTVTELRNRVNEYLFNKSRAGRLVRIGPQVIEWDVDSLIVEIDPVLRDRINIKITLTVPLPLNTVVIELSADVTFNN